MKYKRRAAVTATILLAIVAPVLFYVCRHPEVGLMLVMVVGIAAMLILAWLTFFKAAVLLQQEIERKRWDVEQEDMQREEEHPVCCDPFSEEFEH